MQKKHKLKKDYESSHVFHDLSLLPVPHKKKTSVAGTDNTDNLG